MTDRSRRPRPRVWATVVVLVLWGAVRATAQPTSQLESWKEQAPPKEPRASCAGLRGLTGYEYSVEAAVVVPAEAGVPEFCRVVGQVAPEVRFEVSLPAAWNGRLYMFGNGGYAGESLTAPNRVARRNVAVAKGFAVAQTNTGTTPTASRWPASPAIRRSSRTTPIGRSMSRP